MQAPDGHIDVPGPAFVLAPPPGLTSQGARIPTFIPQANEFARKAARLIGGTPLSMLTEILFDVPGTAHVLGGCAMAAGPDQGVVDSRNRVLAIRTCISAMAP
jgi:cholesterol oxidase